MPKPYLAWGAKLLRNGVDRRDVAWATVAALRGVVDEKVDLFRPIVHTKRGMSEAVANPRKVAELLTMPAHGD